MDKQRRQRQSQTTQQPSYFFEREASKRGFHSIAGVDEAGRGPLAGPVVAAACILPDGLKIQGVNDSKKLTPLQRYQLYEEMIKHPDITFGIGIVEAIRIDQINILQATFEAMLLALLQLKQSRRPPDYVLFDGSLVPPGCDLPSEAIVEGDGQSVSIAAASILAKETRDRLMVQYDKLWPHYNFKQHKGYGTPEHLEAIAQYGPCPNVHRLSFSPFNG